MFSMTDNAKCSHLRVMFIGLGSMQTPRSPDIFVIITLRLTKSIGSSTYPRTSFDVGISNCLWNNALTARGTFYLIGCHLMSCGLWSSIFRRNILTRNEGFSCIYHFYFSTKTIFTLLWCAVCYKVGTSSSTPGIPLWKLFKLSARSRPDKYRRIAVLSRLEPSAVLLPKLSRVKLSQSVHWQHSLPGNCENHRSGQRI